MARSDAQRAADKRYAKKIKDIHKHFGVNFLVEEYDEIVSIISVAGMSKADFIRWGVEQLKKNK